MEKNLKREENERQILEESKDPCFLRVVMTRDYLTFRTIYCGLEKTSEYLVSSTHGPKTLLSVDSWKFKLGAEGRCIQNSRKMWISIIGQEEQSRQTD